MSVWRCMDGDRVQRGILLALRISGRDEFSHAGFDCLPSHSVVGPAGHDPILEGSDEDVLGPAPARLEGESTVVADAPHVEAGLGTARPAANGFRLRVIILCRYRPDDGSGSRRWLQFALPLALKRCRARGSRRVRARGRGWCQRADSNCCPNPRPRLCPSSSSSSSS